MVNLTFAPARLLLISAALLSLTIGQAVAISKTKNCRQCTCDVKMRGYVGDGTQAAMDQIMQAGASLYSGGNGYKWNTVPYANEYNGNADIYRLCGKGSSASGSWQVQAFSGSKSTLNIENCNCLKQVKCRGDTDCKHSTLWKA